MRKWQIVDLVRSFCVVGVIAGHSYDNFPFATPWGAFLWGRFSNNGLYAVFIFFVISGFLITHVLASHPQGLLKPNVLNFYVQRFGRIWPLYFALFGVGILIFLMVPVENQVYVKFFSAGRDYGPWFWLSIPFFMFNWFLVAHPVWAWGLQWDILWSLAVEEQFYLFYPLVLRKMKSFKILFWFLLGMILTGISVRLVYFWAGIKNIIAYSATPAVFDLIAIGIILYLVFHQFGKIIEKNKGLCWGLCFLGFSLVLASYWGTRENDAFSMIYSPEGLGGGIFFFLLGGLHLPFFESKVLKIPSLPGKYCYGCYLFHPIIIFFMRPYLLNLHPCLALLLMVAAVTGVAAVSYHWLEMPVNALIRKKWILEPVK